MNESQGPRLYNFGLSAEQEERARRLHRESIVVDMCFLGPCGPDAFTPEMSDTVIAAYKRHQNVERAYWLGMRLPAQLAIRGKLPAFKEWWDLSGITAGSHECGIGTLEQVIGEVANTIAQVDHLDWLVKALTAKDVRHAKAGGQRAVFIHMQDTRCIERDLDRLNLLYDLGMRIVQLTYNPLNLVGAGCTERSDPGLSYFGLEVVRRLNDLGMIVDTGHSGPQTTIDACNASRTPVIASHTCARALSGHDRGKPDDVLKAIADTGGVVGVVTVPSFLSRKPKPTIEDFLDHVDHIVRLIGVEHVGIGTDSPNCAPAWLLGQMDDWAKEIGFRPEHQLDWLATLDGFHDYRDFVNITRGLVAHGYGDADIGAILGGNFLRVFEQVCG